MNDLHILVVDDEPGIVQLCEKLLHREGYRVTTFTHPKAAFDAFEHEVIDLLLVDIRMPDVSGFDLIERAQAHQPDMAILVMTGFGTVETAIEALRKGVDGLILKPFETGKELIEAARQAIADKQQKLDIARSQALRPLFDIIESFLTETHPERLLELVLNAVCGYLRCDNAGFYRYSPETSDLLPISTRGVHFEKDHSSKRAGVIGKADAVSRPVWINSEGPGETLLKNSLKELGLSSAFVAPVVRQNLRGVLFAGRSASAQAFREVEYEMFLLLVRQAAVAMENARLYEELRDYVRQVEESQQALIRAEKMAAAGRLTASISHEINNPLQAVQNCMHLAMRPELNREKRDEYIRLANSELERLMVTVRRMLDFYRPGGLDYQKVELGSLVKKVSDLLNHQLEERKIRVAIQLPADLPLVLVVASQLEQVFFNIMLNAYDAMPEGGDLRISARPIRGAIEILFHDSGPGVPEEDRGKIFEHFFSTKQSGTGIGLSISYGIIAAHGGSLDLAPDRGRGACFRIILPVKDEL